MNLNPGIVKTVAWLNSCGFTTVDSGDGETHDYECDQSVPYIAMTVSPTNLVYEALRLRRLLAGIDIIVYPINGDGQFPHIEASFDPVDNSALIILTGLTDKMIDGKNVPYHTWN